MVLGSQTQVVQHTLLQNKTGPRQGHGPGCWEQGGRWNFWWIITTCFTRCCQSRSVLHWSSTEGHTLPCLKLRECLISYNTTAAAFITAPSTFIPVTKSHASQTLWEYYLGPKSVTTVLFSDKPFTPPRQRLLFGLSFYSTDISQVVSLPDTGHTHIKEGTTWILCQGTLQIEHVLTKYQMQYPNDKGVREQCCRNLNKYMGGS